MDLEIIFDNLQKEADILYEEYGAIDDIIQLQITINSLRNKFDDYILIKNKDISIQIPYY